MAARHLTDEKVLVGMLRNSRLPTVIVEGKEDQQIYQWVERCTSIQKANVLSVGGRETLLAVYERRYTQKKAPQRGGFGMETGRQKARDIGLREPQPDNHTDEPEFRPEQLPPLKIKIKPFFR